MMRIMIFHIALLFVCYTSGQAYKLTSTEDSTRTGKKRLSNLKLTTRAHSLGLFNYSGRLSSNNPAFDLNVTYDRRAWGFMVFDVIDLFDQHSDNNFTLALLYKKIHLGSRITITPHAGVALEQWGKEESDRQILIAAMKLNKKLTVDNTMLFCNVFLDRHDLDWVNRFRAVYTYDHHVDFTFSLWHNNKIFDTSDYISYGFNMTYGRIKISEVATLSTGITGLVMAATSDHESFPKKNGVVFTLAATFD
jgi:hypothetical protein